MTGEELKRRRKALKAAQADVAYHSGIKRPNIAAMEKGQRAISAKSEKKLEKALKIIQKENANIHKWFEANPGWMDSPELVAIRRKANFPV